ncbi:hypothetical protein RSZ15_005629 [Pseudomonas aeruginosa]|nr:hypothetical protein [Pseudomonas aeruginosa]ELG7944191.1 hypothetical protein [Pseudomonas aeruginosa]ELJ2242652.1 hypothetical protein [Pseudomonas aeruginosa]
MSAYVVDRFHISAILMFTCTGRPGREAREILETQGQQLLDENVRSVRVRYPREKTPDKLFLLDTDVRRLSALEVLKLIECLEHQSSEASDYYSTPAFRTLHAIRQSAQRKLPGWDQANWDYA